MKAQNAASEIMGEEARSEKKKGEGRPTDQQTKERQKEQKGKTIVCDDRKDERGGGRETKQNTKSTNHCSYGLLTYNGDTSGEQRTTQ